jgi:hypothetical protein
VAVAWQVDGDERTSKGQSDRIPSVGVLGATMKEDEFGIAIPPDQRAQSTTITEFYPDSPN